MRVRTPWNQIVKERKAREYVERAYSKLGVSSRDELR